MYFWIAFRAACFDSRDWIDFSRDKNNTVAVSGKFRTASWTSRLTFMKFILMLGWSLSQKQCLVQRKCTQPTTVSVEVITFCYSPFWYVIGTDGCLCVYVEGRNVVHLFQFIWYSPFLNRVCVTKKKIYHLWSKTGKIWFTAYAYCESLMNGNILHGSGY